MTPIPPDSPDLRFVAGVGLVVVAFTALVFVLLRPMGWGPAQEPGGPAEADFLNHQQTNEPSAPTEA